MAPIIKVENISKRYVISHDKPKGGMTFREMLMSPFQNKKKTGAEEEFWALKDINFEVEPGDRVGIIGRNGAGKSTLLKVLSKITTPTTGKITINGRVASLLEVGTGFHPELTGRENIYLNGAILGMKHAEIRKKFDEIVDFSGVEKFLDTPVKRYSSGMYVRLAFAVAAHLEPEILVVDEVLAVGDAEFQKKCLGKMDDISKHGGRTILFVSHNMGVIQSLCNKGILLHNGNIIGHSKIVDCISSYMQEQHSKNFLIHKKGNLSIKMTDIFFWNNSKTKHLQEGEPFEIGIKYESNSAYNHVKILLSINSYKDGCIFFFDSTATSSTLTNLPQHGTIKLTLSKDIALTAGNYYLNIAIFHKGDWADYVQQAFCFEILPGDFYGNGQTPVSKGIVLGQHKFSVIASEI